MSPRNEQDTTNAATGSKQSNDALDPESDTSGDGYFQILLDIMGKMQVPHSFFTHFYVVSVASSLFWLYHILARTPLLVDMSSQVRTADASRSMTIDQVLLTWSLMTIQGVRRLAESIIFSKPSSSKMSFVHWLLGISFYLAMGVAVWIEGAGQLLEVEPVVARLTFSAPSLRTMLSIPVFLIASGIQHDCHAYLASLPKYTLPVYPIFNTFVCPHYTAECLIYLSLALVSAPLGEWFNRTICTAFIFVAVNLSITASSTKQWYEKRFGKSNVSPRWKMLPGLW